MCFSEQTWQWIDYRKHQTPPRLRAAPLDRIDRQTAGRDSLYYPHTDQRSVEETVARTGTYVATAKPATIHKVMEFQSVIGASEGMPSRWTMVESTSGAYHGRPVTEAVFSRKMRNTVPCCDEV